MSLQELSHELRKEAILQGYAVQTIARGYSMFPYLRKGDILTVEPVPMETIKRGDIVVFELEEKWIAHRVIKIRNNTEGIEFLLRGDTCIDFDPLVNSENYVGVVQVFHRRKLIQRTTRGNLHTWKRMILSLGILYNLPLYSARIFGGLLCLLFRR